MVAAPDIYLYNLPCNVSSSYPEEITHSVANLEPYLVIVVALTSFPHPVRRSSRETRPPICNSGSSNCLYFIAFVLNYIVLSPKYQSFVSKLSIETEPTSYIKVAKDARWIDVMKNDTQTNDDNKT